VQEYQYPIVEYHAALKNMPVFIGLESVVAGHEHSSMSVVAGQLPASVYKQKLPTAAGYSALGNATALAKWSYCFDRGDTDTSRGNKVVGGSEGNNWDCSVTGSANTADPSWDVVSQKLVGEKHLSLKLRISRETCLDMAVAAVKRAREYTEDVEFSAEDATRSDMDFLCRVVEAVITAGATTINLPDTVGYSVPDEIGQFFRTVIHRVPNADRAIFSAHCHDDLGLAVANTIAAVISDPNTPVSIPVTACTTTASPRYIVAITSSGVHATTATSDQAANASGR
jgi:hypothetical protein